MPDLPIDGLPGASLPLAGTELTVIVQSSITKQAPISAVAAAAGGAGTTLAGSVSGHAYCAQPAQGALYKRVVITLVNYKSTAQDFTFPAAFANLAQILWNSDPEATNDLTKVSLPNNSAGTAINAVITVEGS